MKFDNFVRKNIEILGVTNAISYHIICTYYQKNAFLRPNSEQITFQKKAKSNPVRKLVFKSLMTSI